MKKLRFHPQFGTAMATTAEDSFNLFRPNLDPEEDELPGELGVERNPPQLGLGIGECAFVSWKVSSSEEDKAQLPIV